MTNAVEVKNFLDSITAMVAKTNEEIVSVSAHVADMKNGVDREITYSVQAGTRDAPFLNVSAKDIYDRMWRCRDFEIRLVWTRATFMTAFLFGCFVAYGNVASRLWCHNRYLWQSQLNGVAACVAAIAFSLSVMWIAMAKGSKAWYEVYESAIKAFGKLSSISDASINHVVAGDWWCSPGYEQKSFSWWRFKGDAISVSRVIIAIGYLFAGVSFGVAIFHLFCTLGWGASVFLGKSHLVLVAVTAIIMLFSIWLYAMGLRSGALKVKLPDCENCHDRVSCKHSTM